jgi:amidophosphoribosyltransferase
MLLDHDDEGEGLFKGDDHPREACGVFGIWGHKEAAKLTYLGLYALQHRGQESCGIAAATGESLTCVRKMGLVADSFGEHEFNALEGHLAIGHVRYSTTGSSKLKNAQPITVDYARGSLAVAHNGNLTNSQMLRSELEAYGSIFTTTVDSEVIVHLIARSAEQRYIDTVISSLKKIQGAYSLLLMNERQLIGVRDPNGFRPLCLGRLGEAYILASETCAFDIIDAEYVRDIEPGEMVVIDKYGLQSFKPFEPAPTAQCVFEFIYFARPDSSIFNTAVNKVRRQLGRELSKEAPVEADLVIPVPDSGVSASIGYAEASGIPFEMGLIRNHYVGRTFIEPSQHIRDFGVKIKLNAVRYNLEGKRVIVVDDSIVRGTTMRKIVKMIRKAGATEVHLRISSPAVNYPCFYGMDFPTRNELIAATHTLDEITKYLRVDSLAYLSVEGMMRAVGAADASHFCRACFDGKYPVGIVGEPQELIDGPDKLAAEAKKKCD